MEFNEADFGVNNNQVDDFLRDIQTQVFDKLSSQLENTNAINDAVNAAWVGKSAQNFMSNVTTGASEIAEQLAQLKTALENEIHGAQSAIIDRDATLVDLEG